MMTCSSTDRVTQPPPGAASRPTATEGELWFNGAAPCHAGAGKVFKILNMRVPVVGIPADRRILGPHPFHCVGEKYLRAVQAGAGALPFLLPVLGEELDLDAVLAHVDGLLFPGSPSNVEPHHYAGPASAPGTLHDPHRDATTLPLLRRAIERDVPVLCICRGFQELNVALGGTLHQKVQEVPGLRDHREDYGAPLEDQYAPVHELHLSPGSRLVDWAGGASVVRVNSLHQQGIDRLAPGLLAEAHAPDGLIEAVRLPGRRFVFGTQWHPEWRAMENPLSRALFGAFGEACRAAAAAKE